MRSLKEQTGKCPPPPALGSATLQVLGAMGSWIGAQGRAQWGGLALGWAGAAVWWVDALGEDQGPRRGKAGTPGLKFCGDINYS